MSKINEIVTIFPNPNKGIVNINFIQNKQVSAEYVILNLNGQQLMKGELLSSFTEIDIRNFSTGTYIVRIRFDGITLSWKILKM